MTNILFGRPARQYGPLPPRICAKLVFCTSFLSNFGHGHESRTTCISGTDIVITEAEGGIIITPAGSGTQFSDTAILALQLSPEEETRILIPGGSALSVTFSDGTSDPESEAYLDNLPGDIGGMGYWKTVLSSLNAMVSSARAPYLNCCGVSNG
jgi:hypothetical protein